MSSSTATISSKNSTLNNNDRKRPISSSIRPSPSPPTAKRHGLSTSTSSSRHSTNKNLRRSERNEILLKKSNDQNERQSRAKQQYRQVDNKSPSSDSSRSSSISNNSINDEDTSTTISGYNDSFTSTMDINGSNLMVPDNKPHSNSMNSINKKSDRQTETLYSKKPKSIPLIVKSSTMTDEQQSITTGDSDDEFERTKTLPNNILNKSTHVVIPSSVMTIVTAPDLSKKSARNDSVIIQQFESNTNANVSTKLVKVVVPQTTISSSAPSSSIKMLSSGDGLASALRIPTKIQLTKPLYVPSTKNDKTSLISSTPTHSISHEQQNLLLSSSTGVFDIAADITEKQKQTIVDYHSSATLPPTPPPPVIDNNSSNIRQVLSHKSNNQIEEKQKINEIPTIVVKNAEEIDSTTINHHVGHQITSKRHLLNIDHASSLVDCSVPSTSELSPTSLTSSSPDLTQNHLPIDDSLVEFDSRKNRKRSKKRRHRSLSSSCPVLPSVAMLTVQSNERVLKPIKSKSLTGLSNSPIMKCMIVNNKRSLTTSPIIKLSSTQRINKRRRDSENLIVHRQDSKIYKSKIKHLKIDQDNLIIIRGVLNDIIDRIISTQSDTDGAIKTLLHTSIPPVKPALPFGVLPTRQRKNQVEKIKTEIRPRTTSVEKKSQNSSQPLDSTVQNESRAMIFTPTELDELAYLLHANAHRGQCEKLGNPAQVEERMREMWSQMSIHKKKTYYNRVIQIYKRPHHNVVVASASASIESNVLPVNSFIDNRNPSSASVDLLPIDLKRQTSTPLSFHSVTSSITDEQTILSPEESNSTTNVFTDIVNELIKGAKGLDKLSCSPTAFVNSIHKFVRSPIDSQNEIVKSLEISLEKKCSAQLNRANIFCTQKVNYFANKYSIKLSNDLMNELTLIVKYFYLYVLSLKSRKHETEFETGIKQIIEGDLSLIDESFISLTLTSIIEDLILPSSLANDYLASQPIIINDIEYLLPILRNTELENEYLNKNDTHLPTSPFCDLNDLEIYLNRCEYATATIPCQPIQQSNHSSMYYPTYTSPTPYYYAPTQSTDMNNYYYTPTHAYQNAQPMYPYSQPTSYYHSSTPYMNSEQFKYYYNSPPPQSQQQQQSPYMYPSQPNSTNDIPLANNPSLHRTYRQVNSTLQRSYSTPQQQTSSGAAPATSSTPAVFDTTTVVSPQSNPMNTTNINNNYPP